MGRKRIKLPKGHYDGVTIETARRDLDHIEEHLISADRWVKRAATSFDVLGHNALQEALGDTRKAISRARTQLETIQSAARGRLDPSRGAGPT